METNRERPTRPCFYITTHKLKVSVLSFIIFYSYAFIYSLVVEFLVCMIRALHKMVVVIIIIIKEEAFECAFPHQCF